MHLLFIFQIYPYYQYYELSCQKINKYYELH